MEDNNYSALTSPTGSGPDRQHDPWNLLWALNMAAAAVARADGRVHAVERLRLSTYLRCFEIEGLKSPLARGLFDKCIIELERNPASERRVLTDRLTGFDGTPWAWVILRAAEHVAAADGTVGDAEQTYSASPPTRQATTCQASLARGTKLVKAVPLRRTREIALKGLRCPIR